MPRWRHPGELRDVTFQQDKYLEAALSQVLLMLIWSCLFQCRLLLDFRWAARVTP
jgi:hypothetical protein